VLTYVLAPLIAFIHHFEELLGYFQWGMPGKSAIFLPTALGAAPATPAVQKTARVTASGLL
jgi:hypothetical protein